MEYGEMVVKAGQLGGILPRLETFASGLAPNDRERPEAGAP